MILAEFWQYMKGFNINRDLIIGHNILNFDLPFIVQRSIINTVRPTVSFYFGKYKKAPIFDTMREWDCWKWGGATSLEKLAFALKLENPKAGAIDGSKIYDAFLESRFEEIYKYCMRDVKTTRNIWRKMNFEFPEATSKQSMALAL
jgi:predicted PolB exonuclease-like 3'-5' exonuclease